MMVGTEWIIDAFDCDAPSLRDLSRLQAVFVRIIRELNLKAVKESWHQFDGEKGVTGLVLLTESHLACHTYPEHRTATFNLYCCRARPEWNWENNLNEMLGAQNVRVQKVERGANVKAKGEKRKIKSYSVNPKSKIRNPKSVGGER